MESEEARRSGLAEDLSAQISFEGQFGIVEMDNGDRRLLEDFYPGPGLEPVGDEMDPMVGREVFIERD